MLLNSSFLIPYLQKIKYASLANKSTKSYDVADSYAVAEGYGVAALSRRPPWFRFIFVRVEKQKRRDYEDIICLHAWKTNTLLLSYKYSIANS